MGCFKELIEKRLYKLYPFCEVTVTETSDYSTNSIVVHLRWFYRGTLYNHKEHFNKEIFYRNTIGSQEFVAKHFVENAIDEIQGIILKED